jgi:transcription initiation factor TFIIB
MTDVFCENHPYAPLINDWAAGDVVCSDCGLVIQERAIDVGTEWRTFTNETGLEEDRSRVGPIENKSVTTPVEIKADRQIKDMADKLNLDASIISSAQSVFHKINEENLLRGRSHALVIATCIYIACRKEHVPRSFKELEAVSKANSVSISRCYTGLVNAFREKGLSSITDIPPISFSQFFLRFCSKLNLSSDVAKLANGIADKAINLTEVGGKRPDSIAAASIYMACNIIGHNKTMNDVSRVTGVAASTIKSTYKILERKLDDTVRNEMKEVV